MISLKSKDKYLRQYLYQPNDQQESRIITFFTDYGLQHQIFSFEIFEEVLLYTEEKIILLIRQNYFLETIEIHQTKFENLDVANCQCRINKISKINTILCYSQDFNEGQLISACLNESQEEIIILTTKQLIKFRTSSIINCQASPLFIWSFNTQLNINIKNKKQLVSISQTKFLLFNLEGQFQNRNNKINFQCNYITTIEQIQQLKRVNFFIKYENQYIVDELETIESKIQSILYQNETFQIKIQVIAKKRIIQFNVLAIFDQNFVILEQNCEIITNGESLNEYDFTDTNLSEIIL